jgi:phytanoyl-CoA hydroxylase
MSVAAYPEARSITVLSADQREQYERDGYYVARGLFSKDEVDFFIRHYMDLRAAGKYPGDFDGVDLTSEDPLKRFPRMIHMHHWDDASLQWLIDSRLRDFLTALLGAEPYAVQTMLYFKPPGARGQALHQDQSYLRVVPGTCMAAWLALDPCTEANGCMRVVPGSHKWPLLCTQKADTTQSFTDVTVPVPEDAEVAPVIMDPGDVLFFNGQLIHGSYPNATAGEFRRALIGHYIEGNSEKVGAYYDPVYAMNGAKVTVTHDTTPMPCGIWVESDGSRTVEMTRTIGAGAVATE